MLPSVSVVYISDFWEAKEPAREQIVHYFERFQALLVDDFLSDGEPLQFVENWSSMINFGGSANGHFGSKVL